MVELGHVVFYVKDLEQSIRFYHDMIGLDLKGRIFNNRAALLSGGRTHHELLLIEIGIAPGPLQGKRIGLYHVGWKIGEDIAALKKMSDRIKEFGHSIDGQSDHTISQSLYLRDPDGNEVELFVDNADYDWLNENDWMQASVKPLDL